jgi:hypothetical protein
LAEGSNNIKKSRKWSGDFNMDKDLFSDEEESDNKDENSGTVGEAVQNKDIRAWIYYYQLLRNNLEENLEASKTN